MSTYPNDAPKRYSRLLFMPTRCQKTGYNCAGPASAYQSNPPPMKRRNRTTGWLQLSLAMRDQHVVTDKYVARGRPSPLRRENRSSEDSCVLVLCAIGAPLEKRQFAPLRNCFFLWAHPVQFAPPCAIERELKLGQLRTSVGPFCSIDPKAIEFFPGGFILVSLIEQRA